MTTHHFCIAGTIKLKLSYRAGKLFRVEKVRGQLEIDQWYKIGALLPPNENDIGDFAVRLKGKAYYECIVREKSLYERFVEAWFDFYEAEKGHKHIYRATEGKAMNGIIHALTGICYGDEAEALATWQAMLAIWPKMEKFYRNNADLRFINLNINRILAHARRISKENGAVGGAYGARL